MSQERLMTILLAPRVTEKTVMATEINNSYAFKVAKSAKKSEIKKAVELMFEVKVDSVRTLNVKGKEKKHGAKIGRRASWKKALVKLAKGESLDIMEAE